MRDITDEDLKLEVVDLLINIYQLAEHVSTPEELKSFISSAAKSKRQRKKNISAATL